MKEKRTCPVEREWTDVRGRGEVAWVEERITSVNGSVDIVLVELGRG